MMWFIVKNTADVCRLGKWNANYWTEVVFTIKFSVTLTFWLSSSQEVVFTIKFCDLDILAVFISRRASSYEVYDFALHESWILDKYLAGSALGLVFFNPAIAGYSNQKLSITYIFELMLHVFGW